MSALSEAQLRSDVSKNGGVTAIKRNKIELFVVRWMDLETVVQSEVSQTERGKQIPYANTYIWNLKKKMVLKNLGAGQD